LCLRTRCDHFRLQIPVVEPESVECLGDKATVVLPSLNVEVCCLCDAEEGDFDWQPSSEEPSDDEWVPLSVFENEDPPVVCPFLTEHTVAG